MTNIIDGHVYGIFTDNESYANKKVTCDKPPPHGFGQAAEAAVELIGRTKKISKISYEGETKLALSGVIVSQETAATVAQVAEGAGKRRNLQLEIDT